MTRTTAEIEQLATLLDDDTLAGSPSDDLRQLVDLSRQISLSTVLAEPDVAFRSQLRRDLLMTPATAPTAAGRLRDKLDLRTSRLRNSLRAGVATGVASAMLGTTGVAFAAQQALPGELLYPVKLGTESIRVALTTGTLGDGRLHLAIARERMTELEDAVTVLDADLTITTLDRMDGSSTGGAENMLLAYVDGGVDDALTDLTDFTAEQGARLGNLLSALPAAAQPAALDSLELLRRIEERATQVSDPCGTCGTPVDASVSPLTPEGPAVAPPGSGPAQNVAPPCQCGNAPFAPLPPPRENATIPARDTTDEPIDGPGEPQVNAPDTPEPTPSPTPDPDGTIDLPGPLGELVDEVETVVDGIIDEATSPLPDPIRTPLRDGVDQVTGTVDSTLDPVEQILEDVLGP